MSERTTRTLTINIHPTRSNMEWVELLGGGQMTYLQLAHALTSALVLVLEDPASDLTELERVHVIHAVATGAGFDPVVEPLEATE